MQKIYPNAEAALEGVLFDGMSRGGSMAEHWANAGCAADATSKANPTWTSVLNGISAPLVIV